MSDPLFEPIRLGRLELPNRILMPAMHLAMARAFQVTDPIVDFYARRAEGGVGLVVVGYATVDLRAGNPTHVGAHDDALIPGLARLARAIRERGAAPALQLNHAGRTNVSMLLGGQAPVAPSAVAGKASRELPRALEEEEIHAIVAAFGQAARRAAEAGFEAVELLAGTGYLVSQFLSPLANLRTDGWGGSFEGRARFGVEVLRAMRAAVGPDFPILARVNGNDMLPGGIGPEALRRFAALLVREGVCGLDMNVGWHESRVPQIAAEVPPAAFAYLARELKRAVDVPVALGHRVDDPALARRLLEQGCCDLVAMGRPLIADPDLPRKAREGREGEILHCLACGQGCLDAIFNLRAVRCLANARAGQERLAALRPAVAPLRVLVVGAGPAGLAAAAAAAERGFQVDLCEAAPRCGGQLWLAGAPPGRAAFHRLAGELEARARALGVSVQLGREVDLPLVESLRPDRVILATGARPFSPPLPGVERPEVVQAWDLLAGRARVGRRAVVVGGNAVGVEVALLLAEEGALDAETLRFLLLHGADEVPALVRAASRGWREVAVVELAPRFGVDLGKSTRWGLLLDLERAGVDQRPGTRAVAVEEGGLRVETSDGSTALIPADTVVLALGARPWNPLQAPIAALGIPVQVAGDAAKVADALKAVHAGHEAARKL